jgi:hypothetical protein
MVTEHAACKQSKYIWTVSISVVFHVDCADRGICTDRLLDDVDPHDPSVCDVPLGVHVCSTLTVCEHRWTARETDGVLVRAGTAGAPQTEFRGCVAGDVGRERSSYHENIHCHNTGAQHEQHTEHGFCMFVHRRNNGRPRVPVSLSMGTTNGIFPDTRGHP